jgi:hypothetical protein
MTHQQLTLLAVHGLEDLIHDSARHILMERSGLLQIFNDPHKEELADVMQESRHECLLGKFLQAEACRKPSTGQTGSEGMAPERLH